MTDAAAPYERWLPRMDPELKQVLPLFPSYTLDDVATTRRLFEEWLSNIALSNDTTPPLRQRDELVPSRSGGPQVPVRIYQPEEESKPGTADGGNSHPALAGLLWIHGGGFVVGSINTEHQGALDLAASVPAVVVSVQYRLAPEHPYPAGLDDCWSALLWMTEHAAELGIDPSRVGVGGISAGGGLSAAIALRARDEGPPLRFQFLGIPELDDRLDTPSMIEFVDTPLWNSQLAKQSWSYYLGSDQVGLSDGVSPYAAPARAADLSGLPAAFISTAELDPLRDEGILYGLRLLQAGVSTELHHYPGTFHGFQAVITATVAKRSRDEMIQALRAGLAVSS